MKKSINLLVGISVFLLCTTYSNGQKKGQTSIQPEISKMQLNRTIKLDGSSNAQEIKIKVWKGTSVLRLSINSVIRSGTLSIEVYDPKKIRKGNISIESQLKFDNKSKELVSGNIQKEVFNPTTGTWFIKLVPNKAVGDISIFTLKE